MDEDFTFEEGELDYPSNLDEVSGEDLAQFQDTSETSAGASSAKETETDWRKAYEDLQVRNAQMESRFEQYQRRMDEQFASLRNPPQQQNPYGQQQQQAQRQQQQPQQWRDPYSQEIDQRFTHHTNQLNQVLGQFDGAIVNGVRSAQRNALKSILNEYPDFHDHIPADKLNQAFDALIKQRHYGLDWEQELRNEYFKAAGPSLAKRAREQQNEVAVKREQKAQQNLRAAQAVTPGGARYQSAQEPVLKKGQRGFKDAREGFIAALEKNGVGG